MDHLETRERHTTWFAMAAALLVALMVTWGSVPALPVAAAVEYPPVPRLTLPTCLDPMTSSRLPESRVTTVIAAIKARAGTHLLGLGPCSQGLVTVGLTPGSERLARQIRDAFGPAVLITVGLTSWNGHTGRSPRCGSLPASLDPPAGLSLSVHLASKRVRSGDNLQGTVSVDYHRSGRRSDAPPFVMDTGQPIEAVVVRRGTHDVVGVYSGGIAGTGYGVHLSPGQRATIPAFVGTARCDGGPGSALPGGRYQVVAAVMDENGKPPRYLTPPVGLTVTPS